MLIWGAISKRDEGQSRSRSVLLRWIIFGAALLFSATLYADDIGDLQSKADAWISKSKEIYRLDCDDMKQIWDAYCSKKDKIRRARSNVLEVRLQPNRESWI